MFPFQNTTRKVVILFLAFTLLLLPIAQMKKAEAAGFVDKLLYAGAAVGLVTAYYNYVNDHDQKSSLASTQKQTGVYDNDAAKQRIENISGRLKKSGLIKANYAIYANPNKEFNAFCTLGHVISINKGTLDTLDDDELAVVMSHEMGHGEDRHVVKGVTKGVSLGLAVDLFLANNQNNTSYVLSTLGANFINNEMFTMAQEWEADNRGFEYSTASGFNPGAAAASMVKMRSLYGELHHEGLAKVVNPNNHPKTSDRVNNFSAKLTAYSNNHVSVKNDKTILIDGKELFTPTKSTTHLAEERSYLIAGNLATVYHNGLMERAYVADTGEVYIGSQRIASMITTDINAEELAARINSLTGYSR